MRASVGLAAKGRYRGIFELSPVSEPTDDILTQPLGVIAPETGPKARIARLMALARAPRAVAAGAACLFATCLTLVIVLGDPKAGEPSVAVAIALREMPQAAPKAVAASVAEADPVPLPPVSAQRSAEEVETASGVTVVRAGGGGQSDAVVIRVPTATPTPLPAAPDPRLVERGRHGTMPKLGENRLRALDIYARPEDPGSGPRIAILVTGLGIGQAATASAIVKLPSAVSLAFAPYGGEVERNAARARQAGHEVFLQAPMEPFDYPDSDPGPQTLLSALKGPENTDRLAWVMSRFPGYVGLVNFMGSKLMADPAFEPLLREIGARGLGFIDDGTSVRALPPGLAAKVRTPVARAEIVIDANPRAEAIDKELGRVEAQARAKGFVLASASALPLTIDRIARWARDFDARGIRLVPVSVALRGPAPQSRLSKAD